MLILNGIRSILKLTKMSKRNKFGIVSYEVITDPELSLQAKAIYSMLCVYANKGRTCYPSIATLADTAGISCSTVDRAIKELKNKDYIKRRGRLFKII